MSQACNKSFMLQVSSVGCQDCIFRHLNTDTLLLEIPHPYALVHFLFYCARTGA